MTPIDDALARLRSRGRLADRDSPVGGTALVALGGPWESRWQQAVSELAQCIKPLPGSPAVLHEGGAYPGAWLESTSSISAEVLARFDPDTSRDTLALHPRHQRDDGLIAYKVTADGPAYSQIQLVTPPARSVWTLHQLSPQPREWLQGMYEAMARYDGWLRTYRDTRGTGAVEAFCTFDTGHDLSPRFWFVADRCRDDDARFADPELATVPYIAPDLTATTICQRRHLALIAEELGEDPAPWLRGAEEATAALFEHCWDEESGHFFDRDATGRLVRVRSDVLLRVLACEVGGDDFFERSLDRDLMRTSAFLSHHGFTSIAMDDPRFDADHTRNSWAGPVNMLTQLRAPHAFEHHGRVAELALATRPLLQAFALADRFPQCIDGWSGEAGYTTAYSPAILWFLDAVERSFGIQPLPGGAVRVSSLAPTRFGHGAAAEATAYARNHGGVLWELAVDDEQSALHRDGEPLLRFPRGWRVDVGPDGSPRTVVGLTPRAVGGTLHHPGGELALELGPNERVDLSANSVVGRQSRGFTAPRH